MLRVLLSKQEWTALQVRAQRQHTTISEVVRRELFAPEPMGEALNTGTGEYKP